MFFKKDQTETLEKNILAKLRTVEDPDLHRNIVELGFVQNLKITNQKNVCFDLVLTTAACPVKEELVGACKEAILTIPTIETVEIELKAKPLSTNRLNGIAEVKNILAVASCKGGVAKTTTALSVALALQELGSKVGVLDADIYGPSVCKILGLEKMTQTSGPYIKPIEAFGLQVASAGSLAPNEDKASILRGPMVSKLIQQLLFQIDWGELDYLVIDYPPGTGDIQLSLSQNLRIDGGILVSSPQELSAVELRKSIHMFQTFEVPIIGFIETMAYFVCDGCEKKHSIFGQSLSESQVFGLPRLGSIPLHPEVSDILGGKEALRDLERYTSTPVFREYLEATRDIVRKTATLQALKSSLMQSVDLKW